ncbi:MAG: SAM-dependent methyltransferase [Candidatus Acidiferrum sp.]
MTDTPIQNVSDTAFWVAHYRWVETQRVDALFRDPLAGVLSGDQGKKIALQMHGSFMTEWTVAIRTCIIDEYIRTAISEGIDAVLNLGAGLDTRPYRMDLPKSFLWVEADYAPMIEFKKSRLARETPRCQLERVTVDLANAAEQHRLLASVAGRSKKLLVLTEGVIPYLGVEEVGSLADELKAEPPVCYWILEYLSPQVLKFREKSGVGRMIRNAPFKFKPNDWFGFFGEHGWKVRQMRYFAEEGERLKRPPRLPWRLKVLIGVRKLFASRKTWEAFRKAAGYALLEPANAGSGN